MKCQREGCDQDVPKGRRKYCSAECASIIAHRIAAAASRRHSRTLFGKPPKDYRPRTCLRCGRAFRSEGPWNRICGDCAVRNSGYGRVLKAVGVADPGEEGS